MADVALRDGWFTRGRRRGLAAPLLLMGTWLLLVDTGFLQSPLLVPLLQVLTAPFADPDGRELWASVGASLLRVATGFSIGAVAGVTLGISLGISRPLRQAVAPTVHTLRQVALFAWIPLLTSWFGNGEVAKIVFISLSAFFPCFLNTEQGVRGIPASLHEAASTLRLPPWQRITKLILPGALPSILIGVEIALLTAWIGTVGSEYAIGIGRGIGAFLVAARESFRMDLVLVGVGALALIGYGFSRLSRFFQHRFITWQVR